MGRSIEAFYRPATNCLLPRLCNMPAMYIKQDLLPNNVRSINIFARYYFLVYYLINEDGVCCWCRLPHIDNRESTLVGPTIHYGAQLVGDSVV